LIVEASSSTTRVLLLRFITKYLKIYLYHYLIYLLRKVYTHNIVGRTTLIFRGHSGIRLAIAKIFKRLGVFTSLVADITLIPAQGNSIYSFSCYLMQVGALITFASHFYATNFTKYNFGFLSLEKYGAISARTNGQNNITLRFVSNQISIPYSYNIASKLTTILNYNICN